MRSTLPCVRACVLVLTVVYRHSAVLSQIGRNLQALAQLAASLPTYAGPLLPVSVSSGPQSRRTPRRMSVVTHDAGTESRDE